MGRRGGKMGSPGKSMSGFGTEGERGPPAGPCLLGEGSAGMLGVVAGQSIPRQWTGLRGGLYLTVVALAGLVSHRPGLLQAWSFVDGSAFD